MKKILSLVVSVLVVFYACSKKSSPEIPEPPPDPGSTGEVKATLSFSSGNTIVLNATGNNTLFNRLIDAVNSDTILSITGSITGTFKQLTVRLVNISSPGTYPFITNQNAPPEGYPQCEFVDWSPFDAFSTMQIRTDPGSVTIQTIDSNYVSGYFNAQLTNWYPGRADAGATITVSNGSFKGNFRTSY
ncbi:MAG TPA: hypothetical protein VFP87_15880 [Chitinophagaceae bacterium]|nr:hypothetical protein [Chitinophagaceae bacterium]